MRLDMQPKRPRRFRIQDDFCEFTGVLRILIAGPTCHRGGIGRRDHKRADQRTSAQWHIWTEKPKFTALTGGSV